MALSLQLQFFGDLDIRETIVFYANFDTSNGVLISTPACLNVEEIFRWKMICAVIKNSLRHWK